MLTLNTIQDGVVVVWHDEEIKAEKCVDTGPVVIIHLYAKYLIRRTRFRLKMTPISLMLARTLSISLWLRSKPWIAVRSV